MRDIKNRKLSLQVEKKKLEFNLAQAMSSPSLEGACYWVDILKKVLSEEVMFLKSLKDPLDACLVGAPEGEDMSLSNDQRDIYAKILNSTPTFTSKHETTFLWKITPQNLSKKMHLKWS